MAFGTRGPSPATPPGARKLRILTIVDGIFPALGGAERQAHALSRGLHARGHDVQLVAPRFDPTRPVNETIDGVPVVRISYPHIRHLGGLVLCLKLGWRLLREWRDYDAIHVHLVGTLAGTTGLLKPLLGATVVVKISGAFELDGGLLDPRRTRSLRHRFLNFCVRRSDYVQCISWFTRQALLDAGYAEHKLQMIPNGVDLARFDGPPAPRLDGTPCIVAYAGRLHEIKGLDVLVAAWPRILERRRARLVLVGQGPLLATLAAQARALGVSPSVTFLGRVDTLPAFLRTVDVYVQPSLLEGLPNSVLEAMAAGLPIVATQVSGNVDLVAHGKNGFLVAPGDAEGLARAIGRLIDDPELRREMGRRSRRIIEDGYRLPMVLDALERAYRREL